MGELNADTRSALVLRRVGIIGNGEDKFSMVGALRAKALISSLIVSGVSMASGHSPKGGVDIWAEEVASELASRDPTVRAVIFHPAIQKWEGGYKQRNLEIAQFSEELHVIVADEHPAGFRGKKFEMCYHCAHMGRDPLNHVKSGACWTALKFEEMHPGKKAVWHIVSNEE